MYIPFISANVFHIQKIKKLKNVKRVCPKRKIKGKKEWKGKKRWKMNPKEKQKYNESVQVQMPLLFTFLHNNDYVQLVVYARIHGNQTI